MISTINDKPSNKADALKQIREFHQPILVELGIPEIKVIPKLFYVPTNDKPGETEVHASFFLSELEKGDNYIESCNRDNIPEDPERTLYKWRYTSHFEEEYVKTKPHDITGHIRYLVPLGELVIISKNGKACIDKVIKDKKLETIFTKLDIDNLPDADTDMGLDQLTIRDLAAIMLNKPVSKKEFLNEIIRQK